MSGIIGGAGTRSGIVGLTELSEEQGTFTFAITGSGTVTSANTQVGTTGYYSRIGDIVFFQLNGYLSGLGSIAGDLQVTGLPFTSARDYPFSISNYPSTNVDAAWRAGKVISDNTYMTFRSGSRMDVVVPYSEVVTGYRLIVAGFYQAK